MIARRGRSRPKRDRAASPSALRRTLSRQAPRRVGRADAIELTFDRGHVGLDQRLQRRPLRREQLRRELQLLLVGPPTVVRGDEVRFRLRNLPSGVSQITAWDFSSSGFDTVSRQGGEGDVEWQGQIVASGTASAEVIVGSTVCHPIASVSVRARDWLHAPVDPVLVPNGTLTNLPSPPILDATGTVPLGYSELDHGNYQYGYFTIGGDGPNRGFLYVTSLVADQISYRFQIGPDIALFPSGDPNTTSEFFRAQCGDFDANSNPTGFISRQVLWSNVREHERGLTLGHYQQYVDTQNNPANNLWVGAEQQVADASTGLENFKDSIGRELSARIARIKQAMVFEACNQDVRRDATCAFRGSIQFFPYPRLCQ
jgi:hypothetical protein